MIEGILSAHNTCWQRKSQGKLSCWPLRKSTRNCCHRWEMIRKPTQPLLTHKLSRKTETVSTHKKPSKVLSLVTNGFVSPQSPCWLINSQGKLSRCLLRNNLRNCFQRWRMESSAHTAPVDSENNKEKHSRCPLRNHHRKCFQRWPVDSSAHTTPVDS